MKSFTSWIFYVWRHVQYCTIRTVTIITQSPYIVRLFGREIDRSGQTLAVFGKYKAQEERQHAYPRSFLFRWVHFLWVWFPPDT